VPYVQAAIKTVNAWATRHGDAKLNAMLNPLVPLVRAPEKTGGLGCWKQLDPGPFNSILLEKYLKV
jgi:hypothetical protein